MTECPYCDRQGYHQEGCTVVLYDHYRIDLSTPVPDEVRAWPVKDVPWWRDPVLRKRWGTEESLRIASQLDELFPEKEEREVSR